MGLDLSRGTAPLHQPNSNLSQSQQFAYVNFSKNQRSSGLSADSLNATKDSRRHFNPEMKKDLCCQCSGFVGVFMPKFLTYPISYSFVETLAFVCDCLRDFVGLFRT
jgi:hypothetical protein